MVYVCSIFVSFQYFDKFHSSKLCFNNNKKKQLEDVEAGGATAFTHAGVVVAAEKKKAVLWWNLLSDGDGDLSTRHGGCPVLFGEKWSMFSSF